MKINADNMHNNAHWREKLNYSYTLQGSKLTVSTQEKNLGMIVDSSMKTPAVCAAVVKKANKKLGCVRTVIMNNTKNIIMPLYKSMVQPHLQLCAVLITPSPKRYFRTRVDSENSDENEEGHRKIPI